MKGRIPISNMIWNININIMSVERIISLSSHKQTLSMISNGHIIKPKRFRRGSRTRNIFSPHRDKEIIEFRLEKPSITLWHPEALIEIFSTSPDVTLGRTKEIPLTIIFKSHIRKIFFGNRIIISNPLATRIRLIKLKL